MNIETSSTHVTPVGSNVFADLGFAPAEAVALKAASDQILSQKQALKAALLAALVRWLAETSLTPVEAATQLGVSQIQLADWIEHQAASCSLDALVDMLLRTGQRVRLGVD